MNGKKFLELNDMILIAVFAALLCITAPFSVPIGPVPVSLATFTVYLAGAMLGKKRAPLAVLVYILLGTVGLPVFSGFRGGLQVVAGVTGGYILGYIPCAFVAGLFTERRLGKGFADALGMVLGTLCCYAFGTVWFIIATGTGLAPALMTCVVPFLPGDAAKILAASALAALLRPALGRLKLTQRL